MFEYEEDKLYQFVNCRILRNHKIVNEDLWLKNGIIQDPEKIFYDQKIVSNILVDCKGLYIFPGLIDLQINGAFSFDFSQDSNDIQLALERVSTGLLQYGVTSFCPTIITSPLSVYQKVLEADISKVTGAKILGFHLEGPFINPAQKGAHPPSHITTPSSSLGQQISKLFLEKSSIISIVTLAPEIEGCGALVEGLVGEGVVVSVGHSSCCLEGGQDVVKKGASLITHLFNAMLPFHHRDPHLVGLLVSHHTCPLYYGVIADGVHTHPSALSFAYNTHPHGMILVTDAVAALGLDDGSYRLGGQQIRVKGHKAVVEGTDVLCGSVTPLNKCVKFLHHNVAHDMVQSIEAATSHPSKVLKLDDVIGSLHFGCHGDLVMMDEDFEVHATFIKGRMVWCKSGFHL